MLKAYKYRLYPTEAQATLINKNIGACRFVYNLALETKNMAYASHGKNLSCFELMGQLPELKKECEWLKEVDSQSLQQSVIDLDKAFTSFFKGTTKFPKYKGKHRGAQTFRHPHGDRVKIEGGKVFQPKFQDGIRVVQDRPTEGEIRSTTISRTSTGKYYISVLCETGETVPTPKRVKENSAIGIDLGLRHFLVTSNSDKVENPRHLKAATSKLKYLQRQASKKKKGSNNRKKANYKVAIQHEKITNKRKDFLHKLSSKLVSENQTLCFEDLNVKGMVKNHNLARSISDVSWTMFVDMCKYKSDWYGKNFLQIGRFEPSSKMCSGCGSTNRNLTLTDRTWTCQTCGANHDRDINAAINIKRYALKDYRGGVRREKPAELPTLAGALKQELVKHENTICQSEHFEKKNQQL